MSDFGVSERGQESDWSEMAYQLYFRARILFRRLWWVFPLTIGLGLGIQFYRELNTESVYVSHARMIVEGRILLPEGAVYAEEYSNFFPTQIGLMTSGEVRRRARERVQALYPDIATSQVNLTIVQAPSASIFNLTCSGAEPEYTQAYLDAIMHSYLAYKRDVRSKTTENHFLSVMEKVIEYQQQMDELEQQRVNFQRENNIVFVKEQGNSAAGKLAELNSRMAELRTELRLLEQLNMDERREGSLTNPALLESFLSSLDNEYATARREVNRLKAERDAFSIYLRPAHPKMIAFEREISRQENLLNILRRQSLQHLTDRKIKLQGELENLEVVAKEWEFEALANSAKLAEFEQINSRLANVKSLHDRLSASIQTLNLASNLDQDTVSIMEYATPPYEVASNVQKQLATGGILGLALGVGILFLAGVLDNRLVSADELSQRFPYPVMGILPIQKDANGEVQLLQQHDERYQFAESCRNIRSSLLFMDRNGPHPKRVMITSSVPVEGKSTLAANLAITLAFSCSRTLLVDADLRRGHLHKDFSLPNDKGLSDMIQQNLQASEVVQKSHVPDLDVVTIGQSTRNPGELLLSKKLHEVLKVWDEQYDYVIFDCPPVLATDDTPSFSSRMDAVLFVVRSNYSRQRQIRLSLDNLELRGAKISGFVLNFVDSSERSHYYYHYQDYLNPEESDSAIESKA